MQPRLFASLILFIGSYLPLSLILLAQDFRYDLLWSSPCWPVDNPTCEIPLRNAGYSLTIFGVCVACFIISLVALASIKPKTPIDLKETNYVPADLMHYTLPYIVSFMSLDYQETGKFIGLIIFLGWMFTITYRSGQLILNPLLVVFGWRLYEVKYVFPGDATPRTARILSTEKLQPETRYNQAMIQDVMIIKSDKAKGGD